ncbi:hypothetical protein [Mongoliibacter ruber]|nr:hypothetical protein [Mongoliibacter ruber]
MKTNLLFRLLFFMAFVPAVSFAQDEKPKVQYTVGGGASIDGNNLLWGLNMNNELNYKLGRRTSLNAAVLFYQSLGNLENRGVSPGQKSLDQSSGIFITPTLKYDILQRDSGFILAFAAGPSLQLGGNTIEVVNFSGPENTPFIFTNKFQRIGLFLELEGEWKTRNPNIRNAVGISAYGAEYYFPWYLNATYKVRFNIGKK